MTVTSLTIGHLLRHAPSGSVMGREAAIIDVAQDLLLRYLHDADVLESLVFKGGTALRKLYAGQHGRFSTDLDFAVRNVGDDAETIVSILANEVDGLEIGPFRFGIDDRRGKRHLTIASDLGDVEQLTSKLDVNPPPWLEPDSMPWVHMPIHDRYGGALPQLPVVRLEENMAEKIARLNRTTTARDVYDLVWIMRVWRRREGANLDLDLVRRLAVLKVWADLHGVSSERVIWKSSHGAEAFDIDRWLRVRTSIDFDDENIGLLAVPSPSLDDLGEQLASDYEFLANLDERESAIIRSHGADRKLVLRMLSELPGGRLAHGTCW